LELLEQKRKLNVVYEDTGALLDSNPKIKLIKNTLMEVYAIYNSQFDSSDNRQLQVETITDDDLPL
jgi:hypothetical protein